MQLLTSELVIYYKMFLNLKRKQLILLKSLFCSQITNIYKTKNVFSKYKMTLIENSIKYLDLPFET